jgi:transposase
MSSPITDPLLLAFDVGAKTHCFAYEYKGTLTQGEIKNEPDTLHAFFATLFKRSARVRVILEATGIYFLDLALIAHAAGAEVVVVNPKAAHNFAKALSQRSKTDALDTLMLLEYLRRMPVERWVPPAKDCLQLRQIGRYLVQLTHASTSEQNRLHALESTRETPAFLLHDLRRSIQSHAKRIARIRSQAIELIMRSAPLRERFESLCTMTGLAETSVVSVLGELCVLPISLSSRACTSHAGLDVRLHQSGTSVNRPARVSKHGNKYLRRAFYMPALSAGVHDPHAAAFKQRLKARGKKPLQINTAIMRKMLTAAWAICKNPQPYDGAKLYANL